MVGVLLNLLVWLVIAVVVFLVVRYICEQAELDPPIRKIILLVLGLVFIVVLINAVAGGPLWGPMIVVGR